MWVRTPGELWEDQSKVDEGFWMERPSHLPQDTRVDNLLELLRANWSAVMNRLFWPQAAWPDHGMEFSDAFTQECFFYT